MTILEYYQKTYDSLIEKRRKFPLTKDKNDPNYIYCETHHILPRCLGGSNDKNNLVNLTAREHFIAHMLLVKIYEKKGDKNAAIKMSFALVALKNLRAKTNIRPDTLFTSKVYQSLREKCNSFTEEHRRNISKAKLGHKLSEEKKKEMRETYRYKKEHGLLSPKVPWNKGIPQSEETKRKVRETLLKNNKRKGIPRSIENKVAEIKGWLTHKYPMIDFSTFDFESYAKIPRHKIQNKKYLRRIVLEEFILRQISKDEFIAISNKYNISHPCGSKGMNRTLEDKIKQAKTRLKNLYPLINFSRFNFEKYCSISNKEKRAEYFAEYRNSIE